MKIALGCDHAAFDEKEEVKSILESRGVEVIDVGTFSSDRCNYPDYAKNVAHEVQVNGHNGILLCGSGIGVSIVANRFRGVRAALCRSAEEAKLSRQHNDANVLCVGARINTIKEIEAIIEAFLNTRFEEGRHSERLALFSNLGEDA